MLVPIPRCHPAFLPIGPMWVGLECLPHLLGRKVDAFAKCAKRASQIDVDNDAANVEYDRSGWFVNWTAKNRHGYSRSDWAAGTAGATVDALEDLARSTLMIAGSSERRMTAPMT